MKSQSFISLALVALSSTPILAASHARTGVYQHQRRQMGLNLISTGMMATPTGTAAVFVDTTGQTAGTDPAVDASGAETTDAPADASGADPNAVPVQADPTSISIDPSAVPEVSNTSTPVDPNASVEGSSSTSTASEASPTEAPVDIADSSATVSETNNVTSTSAAATPEASGNQATSEPSTPSSESGSSSSGSPGYGSNGQSQESSSMQSSSSSSQSSSSGNNVDLVVLNLAFTLEKLESQFYQTALKRFSQSDMEHAGLSSHQARIIIETIQEVQIDESTHVSALQGVIQSLGATPFDGCQFEFGSALSDPLTFLAVSRTLEAVGVSAYLGAAHLLTDPTILEAAGSILTLEARHQSILNTFNGGSFAGQSFDIPLAPEQVLALAGGFLKGCHAQDLGLTANQPLSVVESSSQSTHFRIGSELQFSSSVSLDTSSLSCQMIVGGAPVAKVFSASSCIVPSGIDGPVMIYLTSSNTPLNSNILQMDKSIIVVGPALIFVDSRSSSLSEVFTVDRSGRNHGSRASADFGKMYMHRMSGRNDVIKIVTETETITKVTKEVIINRGSDSRSDRSNSRSGSHRSNSNSNYNSHSRDRSRRSSSGSHRSDSNSNYGKPSRRSVGGAVEVGWH